MRLTSLELSGFRAFSQSESFDFDADTILVAGANGQGKTSLFDAVFWAVAGEIPRLGAGSSVLSLYSPSGEARVAVGLRDRSGKEITLVRSFDGKHTVLSLERDGRSSRGLQAESEVLELLWPQALSAPDPQQALRSALERAVYLQQDLVTGFLSADTDHERFAAISELVGAGRVNELQATLERSRNAWSRATNVRAAEVAEHADRQQTLQAQLEALTSPQSEEEMSVEGWQEWWKAASALGVVGIEAPSPDALEAAGALDAGVKQLQAAQLSIERRRGEVLTLLNELESLPEPPEVDLDDLRTAVNKAERELEKARQALAQAEEQASLVRRRRVELREERHELRALAELALRHLGERCPVCEQTFNRATTVKRLEALASAAEVEPSEELPDVAAQARLVQEREAAATVARSHLTEAEQKAREWESRRERLTARLDALELADEPANAARARLSALTDELGDSVTAILVQREEGEALALSLARAGQSARRAELERETQELGRELDAMQRSLRARQQTGELVATMIEALREASSEVVEDELRRLEPLLQRIYATADPHPAFRVVKLLSRMRQGKGRVLPEISDPFFQLQSETPGAVLSSSQMNVLAVSVFLALNLGMSAIPLETVILDDPLQSLDDLNLLGLVDLLRRTRERRQLFVSTHDARFGTLLERKLRPVVEGQRTVVIELEGWSREGPVTVQRDVIREPTPLRIAV